MARAATSIFYTAKSVRRQPAFSPLDKSRRAFLFVFLSLILLTIACAVFYIATHIQAVNLGYKISQELQKKENLIEENKRLDLEIARLKSPTRIETEAKEKLGLALPKMPQVFYLSRWDERELAQIAAAGGKTGGKIQVPQNPPAPGENSPASAKAVLPIAKKSHAEDASVAPPMVKKPHADSAQVATKETAKTSDPVKKLPAPKETVNQTAPPPRVAGKGSAKKSDNLTTPNPLFAKETQREPSVAKKSGSGVLVAKIVEKEGPRGSSSNNKPAKEKIPAAMIDPLP